MAIYKFKIVKIEEIQAKERRFNVYKTVDKRGNFMDVKFRRDCKNVPTERCVIVVNEDDWNVDDQRQYPVLWIKQVQAVEPFPVSEVKKNNYFDPES